MFGLLNPLINRILKEDPNTISKIQKLEGRRVAFQFTDMPINIEIHFENGLVKMNKRQSEKNDVRLKTSFKTFVEVMKSETPVSVPGISIEGDIMIAHQLQALFKGINLDWEEMLSHFTGDVIANKIGLFAKVFKKRTNGFKSRMSKNIVLFLQEEALILPRKEEVDVFLEDVDHLRDEVQRLENKISRAQSRMSSMKNMGNMNNTSNMDNTSNSHNN